VVKDGTLTYADRFEKETSPKLSPEGKAWLVRTERNLQEAIEAKRLQDPVAFDQLEQNDAAFKRFAYDTHPKAYLDAGLLKLPASDLAKIAMTPDAKDLFSKDGVNQMIDVAKATGPSDIWNVTKATASDTWTGVKDTTSSGANWVGNKASDGWTAVKDWWNK
jgi:hypothetical protein